MTSFTLGADVVIFINVSFTFDMDCTFAVHEVAVENGPDQKALIEMPCTKVKMQSTWTAYL